MAEQQLLLETDLIRQAQHGNSGAYGELYTRHVTAIQHYIQKRIRESGDAEDLTQTVFVKAWQALRDYQPSGAPFRAWLYRIAHNAVVDHYRTQRPCLLWDDLVEVRDPQEPPELRVLATEQQETVRTALATLRPSYQAVLVRRFLQNLDYNETAADLGQQVNHVRVVQHRALDALRRVLDHDHLLWLATTVTMMALLFGGKIVVAAEQALPGDRLYPMRAWAETTTLWLADDATDVRLHMDFATQRLLGLSTLYQQGRRADMTAAVAAAASHIRTASTQLTQVTASEGGQLKPSFAAALQNQQATLQTLIQSEPQTLPALQPALLALTAAQETLSATEPVAPPIPTVTPSATATRILLPTLAPLPGVVVPISEKAVEDTDHTPAVATPTATVAVESRKQPLTSQDQPYPGAQHERDHQEQSPTPQSASPKPTHDLATIESTPSANPTPVGPGGAQPGRDAGPQGQDAHHQRPAESELVTAIPSANDETLAPTRLAPTTPTDPVPDHQHTASPQHDQEAQPSTDRPAEEETHPQPVQDGTARGEPENRTHR